MGIQIAIDGPSGAGKSVISRAIAKKLAFVHVDTGAMYRAAGLCALNNGLDIKNDSTSVIGLIKKSRIELKNTNGEQTVFLGGVDVTEQIRTPEASLAASDISTIGEIRTLLVQMQREIAGQNNVVMDGRDVGTCVLPDATVKIFLTADVEDRAKRRHLELVLRGNQCEFEHVLRDVTIRDEQDSNRTASPLKKADDAIVVDTTGNTLEQSIDAMYSIICGKIGENYDI